MGLEGLALVASGPRRLTVGLVLPLGEETLADHFSRTGRLESEEELRAVLFQVLLGVHELHFNGIWVRDGSPNNFMFRAAPPDAPFSYQGKQLMVIDLGASKLVEELEACADMSVALTPGYGAPEYVAAAEALLKRNGQGAAGAYACFGEA
jgi:serine/threonine protein kinase